MQINWTNCWRVAFFLCGACIFLGGMLGLRTLGYVFGIPGGLAMIAMIIIRFEDVIAFMDR